MSFLQESFIGDITHTKQDEDSPTVPNRDRIAIRITAGIGTTGIRCGTGSILFYRCRIQIGGCRHSAYSA